MDLFLVVLDDETFDSYKVVISMKRSSWKDPIRLSPESSVTQKRSGRTTSFEVFR